MVADVSDTRRILGNLVYRPTPAQSEGPTTKWNLRSGKKKTARHGPSCSANGGSETCSIYRQTHAGGGERDSGPIALTKEARFFSPILITHRLHPLQYWSGRLISRRSHYVGESQLRKMGESVWFPERKEDRFKPQGVKHS